MPNMSQSSNKAQKVGNIGFCHLILKISKSYGMFRIEYIRTRKRWALPSCSQSQYTIHVVNN